jgi:lysophospholipase L1-like esterase
MIRFPFNFPRRKSSSFSSYSSKSRSRKKSIPLPFLVASVPLAILVAELLLRFGVGAMGKAGELAGYFGEPSVVSDYRLQVNTASGQTVSGVDWGELKVRPSALTGYELLPSQKTRAAEINAQGFRASQAIPTAKPAGEVRLLLVGGSVAFGSMSPDNGATIASLLETQLNQQVKDQQANAKNFRPDVLPYFADEMEKALRLPSKIREGQYRVINAAVPGYLTSNVLSQLSNQLLDYQPDVVVLIDGYGDLLAPSDRPAATLASLDPLLSNATGHFLGSLGNSFNGLVNQLYLVKAWNAWILKPNPRSELLADVSNLSGSLTDRLSTDAAEVQKRIDRRTRALESIVKLTNARKIPLIVGLQPEISQVKPATENDDTQILKSLDNRYPKLIQEQYSKLAQAQKTVNGITSLSFQEAIDTSAKAKGAPNLFQDAIHPKTKLNQAIATTLQTTIGPQLQVQPKPFTGSNP